MMIVALSNLGVFLKQKNPFKKSDPCSDVPGSPTGPYVSTGDNEDAPYRFVRRTSETKMASGRRLLTVILEDYYQAEAFKDVIRPDHWYRFEPRIVQAASAALALLDRRDVRATFLASAWVAERFPSLVAEVVGRGHEVALLGEARHRSGSASPDELRDEIRRGRQAIGQATGSAVVGYRFSRSPLPPSDPRILDVLIEEGFKYATGLGIGRPHRYENGGEALLVFPDLASGLLYQCARLSLQSGPIDAAFLPDLINVHAWEFDGGQPRIEAISRPKRLRHYRDLGSTPAILEACLATGGFEGIAASLGFGQVPIPSSAADMGHAPPRSAMTTSENGWLEPVSLVVPCYNEQPTIKYLANTLSNVRERLGDRYDLRLVFVDDGSTDDTWGELRAAFGSWSKVTMVRHERNRGVAASILTGIHRAETEIVCSIDCDCTYDPHEIAEIVPLLTAGADLVTASPYHPLGAVRNVQGARLFLSKSASFLYRRVFRQKLFTYTSCFRVYRRSVMEGMELTYPGFLGVVEILGRLDLRGARVVEYPTTLDVRVFGHSKMKLVRTILAHLGLITRLLWTRLGYRSALSSGGIPRLSIPIDAIELGYSTQKG